MKLKIDWKALGNAAKMAALPVKGRLWLTGKAAILAAVIALTDGCSSLTPSSKTQSMGVYAIGVPGMPSSPSPRRTRTPPAATTTRRRR